MKDKSEITTNGRAVFYTVLWESFRKAALEHGYTLALHGSMASDMDIIAVAWVEDAKPVEDLVNAISECIGKTVWTSYHLKQHAPMPHGRITYTLSIMSDWYIDLSVIPPKNHVERKDEILGHDNPFPLHDVLKRLVDAAEYLLHKQDYDGPDYEEIGTCVKRAKDIMKLLNT